MTRKLGLVILVIAYILLIPGITRPMIIVDGTVDKAELAELGKQMIVESPDMPAFLGRMAANLIDGLQAQGQVPVYHMTRSILGTVESLFRSHYYLVGFLIMLFSVIVPVTKGLLILASYFMPQGRLRGLGISTANLISKWSMADVFVIATVVAYLAFNATEHTEELVTLTARFDEGFYYFLAYCVLSILSAQMTARSAAVPTPD